jgi:hypothetical protein
LKKLMQLEMKKVKEHDSNGMDTVVAQL